MAPSVGNLAGRDDPIGDDEPHHSGMMMAAWILLPFVIVAALAGIYYHRRRYTARRARADDVPLEAVDNLNGSQPMYGLTCPPPCYVAQSPVHGENWSRLNGFDMLVPKQR